MATASWKDNPKVDVATVMKLPSRTSERPAFMIEAMNVTGSCRTCLQISLPALP